MSHTDRQTTRSGAQDGHRERRRGPPDPEPCTGRAGITPRTRSVDRKATQIGPFCRSRFDTSRAPAPARGAARTRSARARVSGARCRVRRRCRVGRRCPVGCRSISRRRGISRRIGARVRATQVGGDIAALGGDLLAEALGCFGGAMRGGSGGLAGLRDELRRPGGGVADDRRSLVDEDRDALADVLGQRLDRRAEVASSGLFARRAGLLARSGFLVRIGTGWLGHGRYLHKGSCTGWTHSARRHLNLRSAMVPDNGEARPVLAERARLGLDHGAA